MTIPEIVARVSGASLESDLSDNQVSHSFRLEIPNLEISNALTVTATDSSGNPSLNFYPNSDISVSGSIQNTSNVRTQEGIIFPVTAKLMNAAGVILDQETLVFPDPNQSGFNKKSVVSLYHR